MSNWRGTPFGIFFSTVSTLTGAEVTAGGWRVQAEGGLRRGNTASQWLRCGYHHVYFQILFCLSRWYPKSKVQCVKNVCGVCNIYSGWVSAVGLSIETVKIPLLVVDVRHLVDKQKSCTSSHVHQTLALKMTNNCLLPNPQCDTCTYSL